MYLARRLFCKAKYLRDPKETNLLNGYVFVKQGIKNLLLAVAVGPVVVVQYASRLFRYYEDGVYEGEGCEFMKDPNHSALVYGYNFNAKEPYLLLKNNWGKKWGKKGYYKMAIGDLENRNYGLCLVANTPYNVMPIVN